MGTVYYKNDLAISFLKSRNYNKDSLTFIESVKDDDNIFLAIDESENGGEISKSSSPSPLIKISANYNFQSLKTRITNIIEKYKFNITSNSNSYVTVKFSDGKKMSFSITGGVQSKVYDGPSVDKKYLTSAGTVSTAQRECMVCFYLYKKYNKRSNPPVSFEAIFKKYKLYIDNNRSSWKSLNPNNIPENSNNELSIAETTADVIYSKIDPSFTYNFHRRSSDVTFIYTQYKDSCNQSNITPLSEDKWNPSDIWIINSSKTAKGHILDKAKLLKRTLKTLKIDEYNDILEELFNEKIIIGVSLKKGKVSGLKTVNLKNDKDKIPKYKIKGSSFNMLSTEGFMLPLKGGNILLWQAKDNRLTGNTGRLNYRQFDRDDDTRMDVSNVTGELSSAVHGKVSQYLIKEEMEKELKKYGIPIYEIFNHNRHRANAKKIYNGVYGKTSIEDFSPAAKLYLRMYYNKLKVINNYDKTEFDTEMLKYINRDTIKDMEFRKRFTGLSNDKKYYNDSAIDRLYSNIMVLNYMYFLKKKAFGKDRNIPLNNYFTTLITDGMSMSKNASIHYKTI